MVSPEQAVKALSDAGSGLWIDLERPSVEELKTFLTPLDLHPLIFEGFLDPAASPLIAPYKKCLFIRLPFLQTEGLEDDGYLCAILMRNAMVTVHASPAPAVEKLTAEFSTTMRFQTAGISTVLFHIIDRLVDDDMASALSSARQTEALAEQMEDGSSALLIDELRRLKRRAARMEDTLEEQRFCVTSLQAAETGFLDIASLHLHFRDTLAHLEYALTSAARQQAHLAELHQHHLLNLQERTNRRLQILTILSSIFMPLTLIAGIYGMNFRHMPELYWTYAYPTVLVAMLAIAGLLLWNFYRKGWFD